MILLKKETETNEEFLERHKVVSSNNGKGNRDFQRSKIYESEKVLKRLAKVRFKNMATMEAWTNENVLPFVSKHYDIHEIVIGNGAGCRRGLAFHDRKTIKMPRRTRKDWYLLHEIAHLPATDHHGPVWCAVYLRLIREFIGPEVEEALMKRFDKNKVKYIDPDNHEAIYEQNEKS